MEDREIRRVVAATPDAVYEFARDPSNLPLWASGLAQAEVDRRGDDLIVESPIGRVLVRFVPHNASGVLDHEVTLPSGETVTNPMRVVAHPEGAEVIFTLRRRDLSDEEFARDADAVSEDLDRLAHLVTL
ncbi:SRPBCC family protein [Nesterenkonia marinintestina]|uniref:SRPBCC family protein n=1 Tax=Nesterenkonia marinintestina TaxID=2979865 RepID=UPI0021C18071|nr:SRPBCC family protein [Nesterenkonia sp. GX14115]